MVTEPKRKGAYYTPATLSDFLAKHIFEGYLKSKQTINILEPSCGDGRFIQSLGSYLRAKVPIVPSAVRLKLVDTNKEELEKATAIATNTNSFSLIEPVNQDYLSFLKQSSDKYSLIIGNPPYIRKENMKKDSIALCEEVRAMTDDFTGVDRKKSKIKNIWPAFVEGAIMSLESDGVLCFVLPAEILQVNYTQELRDLILKEFGRVEIFAFNELIFEGIQQDVVALIGIKGVKKEERGVSFYQVDTLEDLKEPHFTEQYSNIHRITLNKWTNYILSDEELTTLDTLKLNHRQIKDYCTRVQVGIVTAASDYFILGDKEIKSNRLNEVRGLVKPILPKGSTVPDVLSFRKKDLTALRKKDGKVNLVAFPDVGKGELGQVELDYISKGEMTIAEGGLEYNKRYKMLKRKNWYNVPSLWKSEGLFIKRCYKYPKVFVNEANMLATDSFYRISMKPHYQMRNLAFSFYNSLTFVLAELEGRFYGGGVLELTPNEFKSLAIPYVSELKDYHFDYLDQLIRNKRPVEEILEFTDAIVLPDIKPADLSKLRSMRVKLVNRRMKKNIGKESQESNIAAEPGVKYHPKS